MSRAVAYVRLSQDGKSIPRQKRDVENYCVEHDLELVKTYNEGKRASGYDSSRSKYLTMLDELDERGVEAVIVPNLARLSRDRRERLRLLLDLDAEGVDLHSVEMGRMIDLDDDWELVQQSIQATTDDVEKRKEIKRSKRATRERIENGYWQGRPPTGLRMDENKEYLEPDPETFDDVMEALDMLDEEVPYREINAETGIPMGTISRIRDRGREFYEQFEA